MCFSVWSCSNTWVQHNRSMISQSCSKCKTRTRRVDLWCEQHSRIHLTNYVFELIMRTPKKSVSKYISERKDEYTRLTRLGVHGCLSSLLAVDPSRGTIGVGS